MDGESRFVSDLIKMKRSRHGGYFSADAAFCKSGQKIDHGCPNALIMYHHYTIYRA